LPYKGKARIEVLVAEHNKGKFFVSLCVTTLKKDTHTICIKLDGSYQSPHIYMRIKMINKGATVSRIII